MPFKIPRFTSQGIDSRSSHLYANIVASFVAKGWSAVIVLLMVPLTLKCLGAYQNGVWLTVSSMLVWIDQMDIGLGNGLRNKLAAHIAHDEWQEARKAVSSTMAMLVCIIVPLMLILLLLIGNTDINRLLNVRPDEIPELRMALTCAVILVCITLVLKFIGNVYMGLQQPAVSNLLLALGQTLALIATWLLYITGHATFLNVVAVNTAAPILAFLPAYPYTFYWRYPMLKPSIKMVDLHAAIDLANLGLKFFWLQIAAILQFMTANILISQFFTPEMVTPYQIAYRYLSLVMVVFTIICMPFWNATTDAYERGDIMWIRQADRKMTRMTIFMGALLVVMVVVSPSVYQLWIGDDCEVPMGMTVMMALYIFLMVISLRYSFFLNGISALRLQLYMTITTVIYIPLAWYVSSTTHDILWFMAVMSLCVAPGCLANMIQFHKILNGKAKGIWKR